MRSSTNITLDFQRPNFLTVYAVQDDQLSRWIHAELTDGGNAWTPPNGSLLTIRYRKPDGTGGWYDTLEDDSTAYTISGSTADIGLAAQCLTVPGTVQVEISFYTEDAERLSAFLFLLQVEKNPITDAEMESSDYYNILAAQIAAVLGATANPPQIDPTTKNWLVWDVGSGAYVDSGYSSVGEAGAVFTPSVAADGTISWTNNGGLQNPTSRNIKGPQGVSVTSVSKASGTGAPGTTDVYNVNLSDNSVGGTFSVYNGSDGQGSPGSQMPQMDGTGAAGTAIAYSREDHVHPSQLLIPSAAIPIPASGSSASYNLSGLTAAHHVVRWNFSTSAENRPPVDLSITTHDGYFTLTNNAGTTSETIQPIFAVPTSIAVSAHNT